MKIELLIGILIAVQGLLSGACHSIKSTEKPLVASYNLQSPIVTPQIPNVAHDNICAIDFENFSYSSPFPEQKAPLVLKAGTEPLVNTKEKELRGMAFNLNYVYFGDVTRDGEKEAVVIIDVLTGGSSLPRVVYIYQYKKNGALLLWKFISGDRADGGLRAVYSEEGNLVVETYNPKNNGGDCCPETYDKLVYKWNGVSFKIANRRTFPNSVNGANFTRTPSSCD